MQAVATHVQSQVALIDAQLEGVASQPLQNSGPVEGVPHSQASGSHEKVAVVDKPGQDAQPQAAQKERAEEKAERVEASTNLAALTALERHALYFRNDDGDLTFTSIYRGLKKLGLLAHDALLKAFGVSSVISTKMYGCPFMTMKMKDLHKGKHPCDSQVFDADGNFNQKAFEELKSFADTNADYLTEQDIARERAVWADRDKTQDTCGIWAFASSGEWGFLFDLCTDKYVTINDKPVRAITFTTLEQFFKEGEALFARVANGELPAKAPAA